MPYSHFNRFFDDIYYRFTYPVMHYIPDGYELVESETHKKERLQESLKEKKASVEYLTKKLTELTASIANEENELLALSSPGTK